MLETTKLYSVGIHTIHTVMCSGCNYKRVSTVSELFTELYMVKKSTFINFDTIIHGTM